MSKSAKKRLEQYPEISFINNQSFETFLAELIEIYQDKYKELTGQEKELSASDPMRLLLYSNSILLYQGLQYIDRAAKMGLLKYSTGEFLDNLAAIKNVKRLPAKKAVATVRFFISALRDTPVLIPKGTRVKGGELFFATSKQAQIEGGNEYADIPVQCVLTGSKGNGFLPGEIKILVDPVNYIARIENITKTVGGADEEDDEILAERIYLSPSAYSTAGPVDAYRYWVMTYSTVIQDCQIVSEEPGEVDIYIMLQDGEIPEQAFIDGLSDFLEMDNRRPLTDRVVVKVPETQEYMIDATYYISKSNQDMLEVIKQKAAAACQYYVKWQQAAISRDINPSKLMYELMQAGVKWAEIRKPAFTRIEGAKVAIPSSVNLVYGGLEDD